MLGSIKHPLDYGQNEGDTDLLKSLKKTTSSMRSANNNNPNKLAESTRPHRRDESMEDRADCECDRGTSNRGPWDPRAPTVPVDTMVKDGACIPEDEGQIGLKDKTNLTGTRVVGAAELKMLTIHKKLKNN